MYLFERVIYAAAHFQNTPFIPYTIMLYLRSNPAAPVI